MHDLKKNNKKNNSWPQEAATPSEDQNLPAGVDEGAAEGQAVHRLVQQPIKDHLAAPRADGHPELGSASLPLVVVVADGGEEADHLHVEGDGGAQADGRQLIGHLLPVDKHGTWTCGDTSTNTSLDQPDLRETFCGFDPLFFLLS